MRPAKTVFLAFLPFWLFIVFFKFGGNLHFTALPALGEALFPFWLIGLLVASESFLQMVFDVPAGRLLDRYGYLRMMRWGTIAFCAAALILLFGLTPVTYVATILVSVTGWLFFNPGVNAYMLSHAEKGESGRFFSLRDSSSAMGVTLGAGSLPFVLLLPVPALGAIAFLLLAVSLVFLHLTPKDAPVAEPLHRAHPYHVRRQTMRQLIASFGRLNPASGMLVAYNLSGAFFYGVIWFVVPLVILSQEHNGLLGVGLAMFDLSIMLSGYFMGTLADRLDRRGLVFFGLLIFGICGVLAGFNFSWMFLLFGFLASAGDEMAGVSLWAWLHALDKDHANDGSIAGVITLSDDLGWALGPALAGILFGFIGPSWTIMLGAVPILLVWVFFYARIHPHFPATVLYELLPYRHRRRHKS